MDNFIILLFIVFIFLFFKSRKKKKIKQTLEDSIVKLDTTVPPKVEGLTDAKLKEILNFWDEMDISTYRSNVKDATSVLLKLGYKPKQIKETISILNTEKLTTEDMIKQALVILNK